MKCIFYKGCYKYQLTSTAEFITSIIPQQEINTDYLQLDCNGRLRISAGYAWDGATGGVNTLNIMRASLAHDALYQLMRMDLLSRGYRREADQLLLRLCLEDGMSRLRAALTYAWVRILASSAAHRDSRRLEMKAPGA